MAAPPGGTAVRSSRSGVTPGGLHDRGGFPVLSHGEPTMIMMTGSWSGAPERPAGRPRLALGPAWPDNLAAQGGGPATIGSQAQPGKFPVPVLGMIGEDPPHDVPGRAARQVEYEVGVLRHHHSLCALAAMIQSGPWESVAAKRAWLGQMSDRTRGGSRPPAVASWRLRDVR